MDMSSFESVLTPVLAVIIASIMVLAVIEICRLGKKVLSFTLSHLFKSIAVIALADLVLTIAASWMDMI